MLAQLPEAILNVMKEDRLFPPPQEFAAKATNSAPLPNTKSCGTRRPADLEGFWGKLAAELHWFKPFTKVLEWNEPFAEWFVGGQTNVSLQLPRRPSGTPAAEQGRA